MESLCNKSTKKLLNKEETSPNHRLSVHRRQRFHTTAVDDAKDDNVNNNNSTLPRVLQTSGISPFQSPYLIPRNGITIPTTQPVDSIRNIIQTSISANTAKYQSALTTGSSLYFAPSNQSVFPPSAHMLRSAENSKIAENEDDDDDVFVPSNNRSLSNHSSIANHFSNRPNIPFNFAFHLLQPRKRAHSAGDMNLYPPNAIRFVYPNHTHINAPLHTNSLPKSESTIHFLKNSPYIIPQKIFVADRSLQHSLKMPASPSVVNSTGASRSQFTKRNIVDTSKPNIPNPERNLLLKKNQEEKFSGEGNRKRKVLTRKQHLQPREHVKVKSPTQASHKPSTSKSTTRKKVGWNDLAKKRKTSEEKSAVDLERLDLATLNVDVDLLKENPDKFTAENTIGPYLIGPKLSGQKHIESCPVKSISQYLIRKGGSSKYYMAKILHMNGDEEVKCGKMLLHTEHSLLSLLHSQPGVIRQHGIFKDCSFNKKTGAVLPRVCLVLDCITPHEYNSESGRYLNLQQYVIQMKRLSEHEAVRIFYSIVSVVHSLHKANVVHRDLKLGNMVLDKKSRRVILTNFGLGCHLTSDRDLFKDQRGSPAYISPDVLSDKPYAGKPSDMWSLGVILYTMLYGQFPFYDQEPKKLYAKIKAVDYAIPTSSNSQITASTNEIIRALLTLNPHKRLTARDALVAMETEAASRSLARSLAFHVVPDLDNPTTLELTNSQSQSSPITDDEQLTRDFARKMLSDDEDEDPSSNIIKTVRKCKRPRYRSSIPHLNSCLPPSDCYRVQELRPLGARV